MQEVLGDWKRVWAELNHQSSVVGLPCDYLGGQLSFQSCSGSTTQVNQGYSLWLLHHSLSALLLLADSVLLVHWMNVNKRLMAAVANMIILGTSEQ